VHALFLVVAYVLMLRDSPERPLRRLWSDLKPATGSCLALAAVAVPVNLAASAVGAPTIVQLAAVTIAGAGAYLLALRVCFTATWRSLLSVAGQLMPERSRRVFTRGLAPALEPVSTP
jgi:hypothetical protein